MASFKGRLTGCTHLFSIWEKENDFRSAARTFHDEMQLAAGNRCRSLMNQFLSYVINEKHASIELATKCVVHYAIGKARSMGTREARLQMPQAMRIIKFWFHYMDTTNLKYGASCVDGVTDEGFRSRCKKKKLPTLQRGQKLDFDPPGVERLKMTQNRVKVWAMAFEDMVNSIAGPAIASGINVREEKLKFYIPADVTKKTIICDRKHTRMDRCKTWMTCSHSMSRREMCLRCWGEPLRCLRLNQQPWRQSAISLELYIQIWK